MYRSEDSLVEQYAPLVRRQALQLVSRLPSNVELDGFMQAGMMGLLDAVRRYQVVVDAQFGTYAVTRIRGAMIDELRSQDWLPRSVRNKARNIEVAIATLRQRYMREPTENELADELQISIDEYHQLLDEAAGVQLVHYEDLNRRNESDSQALDFLSASDNSAYTDNPLNQLVSGELRLALIQAIDQLPEREKLLLALQFEEDLNQKEIAAVMEVTEGRVSQLRSQAIARIRSSLASADWQGRPEEVAEHVLL